MLFAAFVFVLSGIFGLLVLDFHLVSPIGLPAPVFFPALAGLFGVPTLLNSLFTKPAIPEQKVEPLVQNRIEKNRLLFRYSLEVLRVSLYPSSLALPQQPEPCLRWTYVKNHARTNHRYPFICKHRGNLLSHRYVICHSSARSGITIVVRKLIAVEPWESLVMPTGLVYLLMF